MPDHLLNYLEREHSRLDDELVREGRRKHPDEIQVSRLKKLKLVVKDLMSNAKRRM